jgi:hypothetical protein
MSIQENPKVQRWQQEHVLRLADHFHEYNPAMTQHARVSQYTLNTEAINTIKKHWKSIQEISIHLGLKESETQENTITFAPIFVVKTTEEFTFEMSVRKEVLGDVHTLKTNVNKNGEFVPKSYVDMVTDNWKTIDFHLVDDLFVVQTDYVPVRVLSYHFTKEIVSELTKLLGENLLEINLYLGVDMNKFGTTTLPSFTPVYGFKFSEVSNLDIVQFFQSLTCYKSNDASEAEEIFVQYSSPCPPTCR